MGKVTTRTKANGLNTKSTDGSLTPRKRVSPSQKDQAPDQEKLRAERHRPTTSQKRNREKNSSANSKTAAARAAATALEEISNLPLMNPQENPARQTSSSRVNDK